jgi:hypothetical protein
MAANFGVLEIGQDLNAQPKTFISKSHALLLLRRLEAEAVGKKLIRRLKIKAAQMMENLPHVPKLFIPEKMPSHKAPGTRAIGPVVEQTPANCARILLANMIAAGR